MLLLPSSSESQIYSVDVLNKLLYLQGVAADYLDYFGEHRDFSFEDRLKVLSAIGYSTDDAPAMEQTVYELDGRPWESWLRPLHICRMGADSATQFSVSPDELAREFSVEVRLDTGELRAQSVVPGDLPEVGDYSIGRIRYSARSLPLGELPPGYHSLTLSSAGQQQTATLLVSPPQCYAPRAANTESDVQGKLWGVSCQLYSLRSDTNWGIGDFTDLFELVGLAAQAGADMVAVNPVHAPLLSSDDFASPYSPSDRRFLNILYIDALQSEDFQESSAANALFNSKTFQHQRRRLRNLEWVDYSGVWALKRPIFEAMYAQFSKAHLQRHTKRAADFEAFVAQQADALAQFAGFEAQQYRKGEVASLPQFHQYLQWQADLQLRRCQQQARHSGMQLGLVGDLAVGSLGAGAETVCNPDIFTADASIGAPPDPFSSTGQNWNLPPLNPAALRRSGYTHFIQLLRANMRGVGGLRIDHVMGLLRLWWCIPDTRDGGVYVYNPFDDLLAILRLESHLNRCVVVGEDMGVVPPQFRESMEANSIFGSRLLYFETHEDGTFKPPAEHPSNVLFMITNHDVPTLAGWWAALDITLLARIGRIEQAEQRQRVQQRNDAKAALLTLLDSESLLSPAWQAIVADGIEEAVARPFDAALATAILTLGARSNSKLLLTQVDDLEGQQYPVNIPGTHLEYPNWKRKLQAECQQIFARQEVKNSLLAIQNERSK